mmetsp:Transcript_25176/g.46136  ORF Transcript_25176/g.46136 Transcript_25176/m.46136 type:complete len:109 (-) Transcript_25176:336-662(-)
MEDNVANNSVPSEHSKGRDASKEAIRARPAASPVERTIGFHHALGLSNFRLWVAETQLASDIRQTSAGDRVQEVEELHGILMSDTMRPKVRLNSFTEFNGLDRNHFTL